MGEYVNIESPLPYRLPIGSGLQLTSESQSEAAHGEKAAEMWPRVRMCLDAFSLPRDMPCGCGHQQAQQKSIRIGIHLSKLSRRGTKSTQADFYLVYASNLGDSWH